MANHLRLPTHLIPEMAIFLSISDHLNLYVLKLLSIVKLLLLFFTIFLKYLPVTFSGWLARSKHLLIYFCWFRVVLWLLKFNGCLNDLSYLLVDVVVVSPLTCVRWSFSDSLERNNYYQFVPDLFKDDNHLFVPQRYDLNRYYSHQRSYFHLTSDKLRHENRRRVLVAKVQGEPVSEYETPIIESDKSFFLNRELSNDTVQTEDLFGLPDALGTEILKKLPAFYDFAFCSTVCRRWRSACLNLKWSLYPPHPWSIHFQDQNILNHLNDGKYVLERWEIQGRYYYGCINGWILNIGSANIHIFNLFSRIQTNLPILSRVGYLRITKPSDWYDYIEKFILFKACHDDNLQFLVVALFGARGFIAFTGPQFQDWICIESDDLAQCRDVVLFRGQFYALCGRGKLFLCAFNRSNPCVSLVSQQPTGSFRAERNYLVKNVDHLIAVFQDRNWDSGVKRFGTKTFRIYRSDDNIRDWTQIRETDYLKSRALFIFNGNSRTIDSVKLENCRPNSIYFVDDYWFSNTKDGHFIGVFDIANGKIEDFQLEMDQYPPNDVSPFSLTDNVGA